MREQPRKTDREELLDIFSSLLPKESEKQTEFTNTLLNSLWYQRLHSEAMVRRREAVDARDEAQTEIERVHARMEMYVGEHHDLMGLYVAVTEVLNALDPVSRKKAEKILRLHHTDMEMVRD